MLARTYGPKFKQFPCYIQPKLNGVRALYQNGTLQSRDGKLWSPHVMFNLLDQLAGKVRKNEILDGELYVHGWKLQRINRAISVNRQEPIPDTFQVTFSVFDVVNPNLKFSERWLDTYHQIRGLFLPHIHAVQTELIFFQEELDLHFHNATTAGFEGVMLRPDGPYEFGERLSERVGHMTQYRSEYLWKKKQWKDGEFVCVGVTKGEGKANIGIGALVCQPQYERLPGQDWPKVPQFKVGTGFDDEERIEFAKNPPIGKLVRVRYLELTQGGIPFNPSFLCVMD